MLYGSMYALLALNSGRSTKLSKVVTGRADRIRKVLRRAGYRRCSGPGGGDVSNRTAKTDADGRPFIKMPWPFNAPCKFRFDGTPYWEGFDLGTRWGGFGQWSRGFGEVGVTDEVRGMLLEWFLGEAEENADNRQAWMNSCEAAERLDKLRPCANGLIYLKRPWMITVAD